MDNRINDKDLAFVNGGSAATGELLFASKELRKASSLFTDDMPGSVCTTIAYTADLIDRGYNDVFYYKLNINTAINKLQSFMGTIAENPDICLMVDQILTHLNRALSFLNN